MDFEPVEARNAKNQNIIKKCYYEEINECPSCHYGIDPQILGAYYVEPSDAISATYHLYLIYGCRKCKQVFMSKFEGTSASNGQDYLIFQSLIFSLPYITNKNSIPKEICKLSPDFAEIYTQARTAEEMSLSKICGLGYRKSLEFLVKDYLCAKYADQADKIRAEPLSHSIRRIDNENIRILAERSAWIGNDETHYVRKHSNLDVQNMKCFINAILPYIQSELAVKEALRIEPK